ncbi:MAG: rRNA ((2503)-C(2))-methyltransferase, partial [Bacteroidota bacterium]
MEEVSTKKRKSIRKLSLEQIKEAMQSHGQPGFRAKQIYEWIWNKSARSFDQMQNIPKDLRAWLEEEYELNCVEVDESQISSDRTI